MGLREGIKKVINSGFKDILIEGDNFRFFVLLRS